MTTTTLLTIAAITATGYALQVAWEKYAEEQQRKIHRRIMAAREKQRQDRIRAMERRTFKDPNTQPWSAETQFLAEVNKRAARKEQKPTDD